MSSVAGRWMEGIGGTGGAALVEEEEEERKTDWRLGVEAVGRMKGGRIGRVVPFDAAVEEGEAELGELTSIAACVFVLRCLCFRGGDIGSFDTDPSTSFSSRFARSLAFSVSSISSSSTQGHSTSFATFNTNPNFHSLNTWGSFAFCSLPR